MDAKGAPAGRLFNCFKLQNAFMIQSNYYFTNSAVTVIL